MLYRPHRGDLAGIFEARIERATMVTPGLIADIVDYCGSRPRPDSSPVAQRLHTLLAAGAFTDAALAVIAIDLPRWSLTRLLFEDGEWLCTLAQYPQMPAWLDEVVDGRHASLPLAILAAAVAARAADLNTNNAGALPVAPVFSDALCCDNFA
jgi:hypothetical protein